MLRPQLAKQCTLPEFAEKVVGMNLASYRKYPRLLSSIAQFFRAHRSAAFRRKVDEIETRTFRRLVEFLMNYRKDIKHPDPEAAIALSLLVVALAIREIALMEIITDVWKPLLPKSDQQMVQELTSMMLRYLRYEGEAAGEKSSSL
jgi:hypothetical protein